MGVAKVLRGATRLRQLFSVFFPVFVFRSRKSFIELIAKFLGVIDIFCGIGKAEKRNSSFAKVSSLFDYYCIY